MQVNIEKPPAGTGGISYDMLNLADIPQGDKSMLSNDSKTGSGCQEKEQELSGVFHLYQADTCQVAATTVFPHEMAITSVDDLALAASKDNIGSLCKDYHRGNDNFISADVLIGDVDNGNKNDPELTDWKTPADVVSAFPSVRFYVVYSRHHNKAKDSEGVNVSARPRFHVYFPLDKPVDSLPRFNAMKQKMQQMFPALDTGAKDPTHLMYGVKNPRVEYYGGTTCIDTYLGEIQAAQEYVGRHYDNDLEVIQQALDRIDVNKLSRDKWYRVGMALESAGVSFSVFDEWSSHDMRRYRNGPMYTRRACQATWDSFNGVGVNLGTLFYMAKQNGFTFPHKEKRSAPKTSDPITDALAGRAWDIDYHPGDYSDLGVCMVFVSAVKGYMYHCKERGWLTYIDGVFRSDAGDAQAMDIGLRFTDFMLRAARSEYIDAQNKAAVVQADHEEGKASDEDVKTANDKVNAAKEFLTFAVKYRADSKIKAFMSLAAVKLFIDYKKLDADPYLLNCPDGVIDLKTGRLMEHSPKYLMTKCAGFSPASDSELDSEGARLWYDALNRFTAGNTDLIHYFQELAGSWAIGKTVEKATFFWGQGGNGKSTLLNPIATAFGNYYVKLNVDTITTKMLNPGPEIVRLAGARFCLMSEMERDRNLAASILKQICSTDDMEGAAKFMAPETFKPSHSTAIMTNWLPNVNSGDTGLWDRIQIFPCTVRFRGTSEDIPDYGAYMLEHGAGPVIMRWIVDGAVEFIANGSKITPPDIVLEATSDYRDSQDWLQEFLDDCCDTGDRKDKTMATDLYIAYKGWIDERHEYARNSQNFDAAMTAAGYKKRRTTTTAGGVTSHGYIYDKIRLNSRGLGYLGG